MDIKEFWEELKERINNPFFGSFVLSWLVCNWKIPMILLFYKSEDLARGNTNFIKIIEGYLNWYNSIVIPLVIALTYTFLFPYFKDFVKVYLAKIAIKTDEKLLEAANTVTIPVSKFTETKAQLKKQENDLASLISEESLIKSQNIALEAQIIEKDNLILKKETDHLAFVNNLSTEKDKATLQMRNSYDERINRLNADNEERVLNMEKSYLEFVTPLRKQLTESQLEIGKLQQENEVLNATKIENNRLVLDSEKVRTEFQQAYEGLQLENVGLIADRNELNNKVEVLRSDMEFLKELLLIDNVSFDDGRKAKLLTLSLSEKLKVDDIIYGQKIGWGKILERFFEKGIVRYKVRHLTKGSIITIPSNLSGLHIQVK